MEFWQLINQHAINMFGNLWVIGIDQHLHLRKKKSMLLKSLQMCQDILVWLGLLKYLQTILQKD